MSGNTIGVLFRVTTFGESHGPAIGAVIDGCPPNLDLGEADIQAELDRRKPGGHKASTPRKEEDRVEILSGVFEGKTTGTPIALLIRTGDAESAAYDDLRDVFRPGHGDYTYLKKYGIRDHRGGGRASGRETAARVAAGAVARKLLAREGIDVLGCTVELGGIGIETWSRDAIGANRLLCPDPEAAKRMEQKLEEARGEGDSLGGIVEIRVTGCPAGLGRARLRQDRCRSGRGPHGHRDGEGRRDRRRVRGGADERIRRQRPHRPRRASGPITRAESLRGSRRGRKS